MTEESKYTFKINDLTPETISFIRLIEYYSEINKMIKGGDELHLLNITKGSHCSILTIDNNQNSSVIDIMSGINSGTASQDTDRAVQRINAMLKSDNPSAHFSDPQNQNIVQFSGKHTDTEDDGLIKITGNATFTGKLYSISGKDNIVNIRLDTNLHGNIFGTISKDKAIELSNFLFEFVRVNGQGKWIQEKNGNWKIQNFTITDFKPVKTESLRETVDELRAIDVHWPEDMLENPIDKEKNDGQVH